MTLAGATNIGDTPISKSTAIVAPLISNDVLAFATPKVSTETSVSYHFTLNAKLKSGDEIAIVLPDFTFGTLASPTKSGCGTTTFTAAGGGTGATATPVSYTHLTLPTICSV